MASYGSMAGVQAIVPAFRITATSTPNETQVDSWLSQGKAIIDQYIAGAGYVVPVEETAAVYASVTALNDLYGAAYVLRARGIDPTTGQPTSESYLKDFYGRLRDMVGQDMTLVGVPLLAVPSPASTARRVRSLQMRRIDGYSPEETD